MKQKSHWKARGKSYRSFSTKDAVAIFITNEDLELKNKTVESIMNHVVVEVYSIKEGMESFLGYPTGYQKERLLKVLLSNQ